MKRMSFVVAAASAAITLATCGTIAWNSTADRPISEEELAIDHHERLLILARSMRPVVGGIEPKDRYQFLISLGRQPECNFDYMGLYWLVEFSPECCLATASTGDYDTMSSPELALAEYHALVECCLFPGEPAEYLIAAMEDPGRGFEIKRKLIEMTAINMKLGQGEWQEAGQKPRVLSSIRSFSNENRGQSDVVALCSTIEFMLRTP